VGIIGRIGKVLNHDIKELIEIISETYKGFNQKAVLYDSSGEDSPPVKGDKVFLVKADGIGKYIIAGVLSKSQGAKPGEKYLFSRDTDGILKAIIKLYEDGVIQINNGGNKAARLEDTVKIIIPANTFVVSVTGGGGSPAVATLNPTAIECEGKITSGSEHVIIGD
jgi:hypothetical protein